MKRFTDEATIKLCCEKLSKQFPETWDEDVQDLLNDNMHVLSNDEHTTFFILRIEGGYTHYDWGYVDEKLRGQGIGKQAVQFIVEYAKQFKLPVRATVRIENIASYKTMLYAGFKMADTTTIGSSTGVEMLYYYIPEMDLTKYDSKKPSSCGLFVLSALSELKYNNYIAPDELNAICVPNLGISKETMIRLIMSLFKEYTFKVVSNYTDATESAFHLIENYFTKPHRFAVVCVKEDLIYDHWMLVLDYDGRMFTTIDSEHRYRSWTKLEFFSKMIQSNLFSILI